MPILAGSDTIKADYAGMGEPSLNTSAVSGALAYNAASPQTVTATIAKPDGVTQPQCKRGKYRLRITGVTAGTTLGIIKVTVDDGAGKTCTIDLIAAGIVGNCFDTQREIPPIDNAVNGGGANDGMPLNIVNINAIVAFTTTDGAGNSIGDVALEFFGGP